MSDLLTFEELRNKVKGHFADTSFYNFSHADIGRLDRFNWLKREYANLVQKLSGCRFQHVDMINAFYSAVFELEFKKKFFPNSLITHKQEVTSSSGKPRVSRLIRFSTDYPKALILDYSKDGVLLNEQKLVFYKIMFWF